ncbi:MAG TPA: hypothetical protein VJT71_00765 [Pyrinomonadaceae bacterium]|nr:hypothetical protein [Pyrinomonadaceae bacterium]
MGEQETVRRCERCDRVTNHVIESIGSDNRPHYLCWECVERHEKRFNQKPGWRRANRTQRYLPSEPTPVAGG